MGASTSKVCARVRVALYSDESLKGTRQPHLPILVLCVVYPQLSCGCQPPFTTEASLHACRLSLWVLLVFQLLFFPSLHCLTFTFTILHNIEDYPRISASCDRNSEDDVNSHAPGPGGGRSYRFKESTH